MLAMVKPFRTNRPKLRRWFLLSLVGFWIALGNYFWPDLSQATHQPITAPPPLTVTPLTRWPNQSGIMLAQHNDENSSTETAPLQTGIQLFEAGQLLPAIHSWQQALTTYQQQNLPHYQVLTYHYLAVAYQELGQWQQAQQALRQAHLLLQHLPPGWFAPIQARLLTAQARLDLAQGRAQTAETALQQAADLYQQLGDAQGVLGTWVNQAQALLSEGRYRPALKRLQFIRDRLDQQPAPLAALGHLSLGTVYQAVGDLQAAWCETETAQTIAEDYQLTALMADISLGFGNIALALGQRDQINLHPAIPQRRSFLPTDSLKNQGRGACQVLSGSGLAVQRYRDAQSFYAQASQQARTPATQLTARLQELEAQQYGLAVLSQSTNRSTQFATQLAQAHSLWWQLETQLSQQQNQQLPSQLQVLLEVKLAMAGMALRDDWAQAQPLGLPDSVTSIPIALVEQGLKRAIATASILQSPQAQRMAYGALGYFYEQQEQWPKAQAATKTALQNTTPQPDAVYQWQWQLGRIQQAMGQPQAAQDHYRQAINALQQVRPTFTTLGANLAPGPNAAPLNLDFQYYFRDRVEPIYRDYMALLLSGPNVTEQNLLSAITAYELLQESELETLLRCNLRSRWLDQDSSNPSRDLRASAQRVQQKLRQIDKNAPHTAVLFPIEFRDRIELIVFAGGHLHHAVTETPTLAQTTWNLAQALTPQYDAPLQQYPPSNQTAISKQAQTLYRWIIEPIQTTITQNNIEHLIVMPDGLLRNIPLAVLQNPQNHHYLVQSHSIAAIPSLLETPTFSQARRPNVLAAGLTAKVSPHYFPLAAAQLEIDHISQLFRRRTTLTADRFTWPNLQQHLATTQYSHLHIVTHGQFSATPQGTFLIDKDERKLTLDGLDQLLEHQTTLDLLTLSACQTAQGDNRAALGLAGVALQSGAHNTLATLFIVPDQFAAKFMQDFYQALHTGLTPAMALQQTQKHYLKQDPALWTPYVIVGTGL